MKVTYTPKGKVKIVLTEDEAHALAGVLVNSPTSPETEFIPVKCVQDSEFALTFELGNRLGWLGFDGV